MVDPAAGEHEARPRQFARAIALLSLGVALLVLTGWATGQHELTHLVS